MSHDNKTHHHPGPLEWIIVITILLVLACSNGPQAAF